MTNLKTIVDVYRDHPSQKSFSMIGRYRNRQPQIPQGLIIPFNDTSIPDGWERFTSADNLMLVGAGNSYSIGGNVNGLSVGASVGIRLNGVETLVISGSQPFTFTTPVVHGNTYGVQIIGQPANFTCGVVNGNMRRRSACGPGAPRGGGRRA